MPTIHGRIMTDFFYREKDGRGGEIAALTLALWDCRLCSSLAFGLSIKYGGEGEWR
jgi:hypothetical protein